MAVGLPPPINNILTLWLPPNFEQKPENTLGHVLQQDSLTWEHLVVSSCRPTAQLQSDILRKRCISLQKTCSFRATTRTPCPRLRNFTCPRRHCHHTIPTTQSTRFVLDYTP